MNIGMESETVEHKKSTSELKEGVSSIAAILNKHKAGELYFGVKNNGDVCGMQVADTTLREISQTIAHSIEPKIHPVIEKLSDGEGRDYIRVSFSGDSAPYSCKGVFRIRVSDEDVLMSPSEVRRAAARAYNIEHPWDQQLSNTPVDSIRENVLKDYISRGRSSGRISFDYEDPEDALARLELAEGGLLTNAACVLFCKPDDIMLKMAVFATDARINILDMHQEQEDLFTMAAMAENYVMRNLKWRFIITGEMQRTEVPEIPRAAIKEALLNAFCHRDYTSPLAVQVDIFGDKVEVFNPGWFPEGITPEELLAGTTPPLSKSPNRLISRTLYRSRDIESYGTGIQRIKALCSEADIRFEYARVPQGTILRFYRPNWFENDNGGASADNRGASADNRGASADNRGASADNGGASADNGIPLLLETEAAAYHFMLEHGMATSEQISQATGLSRRGTTQMLRRLIAKDLVVAEGGNRNRTYRAKQ